MLSNFWINLDLFGNGNISYLFPTLALEASAVLVAERGFNGSTFPYGPGLLVSNFHGII